MKNSEMAAVLREFADKIDATEVEMDLRVELNAHGITKVDVLRAVQALRLDGEWEIERGSMSDWICNLLPGQQITAFFDSSLRQFVKPRVDIVDEPDLVLG